MILCLQSQQDCEQDEHEAFVFNVTATRREKYITFLFEHRKDDMMLFSTDYRLNYTSTKSRLLAM